MFARLTLYSEKAKTYIEQAIAIMQNKTKIWVLYGGSIGGCAESVSKELSVMGIAKGLDIRLMELNKYEETGIFKLHDDIDIVHNLIIVCSTTGNGEAPENAAKFYDFIRIQKSSEEFSLKHLNFVMLAIGDKQNYRRSFCAAGKGISHKLKTLGAMNLRECILANSSKNGGDFEQVIDKFKRNVWGLFEGQHYDVEPVVKDVLDFNEPSEPSLVEYKEPLALFSVTESKVRQTIWVLYGSARGNAEAIAKKIVFDSKEIVNKKGFDLKILELNDYIKTGIFESQINHTRHKVIIVCSTTGSGESPQNAYSFLRFLRMAPRAIHSLKHLDFAVLAIGDSSYGNFCKSGKDIDSKLKLLGAIPKQEIVCADDSGDLSKTIEPFIGSIWDKLLDDTNNTHSECDGELVKDYITVEAAVIDRIDILEENIKLTPMLKC